ncbi:MAG: hypothetical protein MR277_03455 [Methanobrevibacter ruminantium]|uniref:hypothetical protein n=1 Tax=Methanobrevibacter ruminantium TaxID=83816 RepID=UPI002D7E402F|nr:hypothetical protein [Methanobrevibacter ruminantium]MCI5737057.1 hypothetical protein [Methanobrevibacter ruminantium]
MSDIARIVIFKKENGEEFTFDDKYVQLTSLENKMLIFKFEASQDILKEGAEFFSTFNTYEQIKVDIGGTGEIPCYMKSLSPIVGRGPKKTNGEHLNGIFTLSLQQIVAAPDSEEEQNCLNCALSQNGVCSIKDNNEKTTCDDFKK